MSLNITGILNQITSHASASGLFERVNGHEPTRNAPGSGLTCAVWVNSIDPARGSSGLASGTGLVQFQVRVYTGTLTEPQDAIDPAVVSAVDALLAAYSGDFQLGDTVRCVDLLGQAGTPLSARAGYLQMDGAIYRVMTITLPVLVNDLWEQVA